MWDLGGVLWDTDDKWARDGKPLYTFEDKGTTETADGGKVAGGFRCSELGRSRGTLATCQATLALGLFSVFSRL